MSRVPGRGRGERGELRLEPLAKSRRGLAPERQAVAAALEPVLRGERGLAPAGRVRELVLGARPVAEQRLEPRLRAAPRERGCLAAALGLGAPALAVAEIELRDPRAQRRDLGAELLRALGGGRLERERAQPLPHLRLDVARALDLERDARELQLRAMPAALELPEAGSLLDERAPVLRLRGEHLLDLALPDDRVHRGAEADVGEQLDEIGAPDRRRGSRGTGPRRRGRGGARSRPR